MCWVVLLGSVLGGCAGDAGTPKPNTLLLELGGDSRSLREDLRAAGVVILSSIPKTPPEVPQAAPPQPERAPDEVPQQTPVPPPQPVQEVPSTTLREGETLIHVARRALGDGRRYRDLMQWNGWTDQQSRRLAIGTKVKLAPDAN